MTKHKQLTPTYTRAEQKAEREIDSYLGAITSPSIGSIMQQLQQMS